MQLSGAGLLLLEKPCPHLGSASRRQLQFVIVLCLVEQKAFASSHAPNQETREFFVYGYVQSARSHYRIRGFGTLFLKLKYNVYINIRLNIYHAKQ